MLAYRIWITDWWDVGLIYCEAWLNMHVGWTYHCGQIAPFFTNLWVPGANPV